jgi:hypothetical protein
MRHVFLVPAALVSLALLAREGVALAEEPRSVVVEYVAPPPPECASPDAFRALLAADVERGPRARSDWHFAVHIRRSDDGYTGVVTSEAGARTVHAATCDETTAALARDISGLERVERLEGTPVSAPAAPAPLVVEGPASRTGDLTPPTPNRDGRTDWRLGFRAQAWTHGAAAYGDSLSASYGGMGVLSVEFPWGVFHRTLFEVAAGAMDSTAPGEHLMYYAVDTQTCPFDLGLGRTGLSLLGCLRLAGAWFDATDRYAINGLTGQPTVVREQGGALWFGAGARVRWQLEVPVFLEAHLNGVYGTVSGPEVNEPAWVDIGAMVGVRL